MSDELTRIEAIRARLSRTREDVVLGIGDDAALLAASPFAQALSVDVAVEGVHFRRDFAPWPVLGRRAFVAAASDLAAMGARPRASLLALVLPAAFGDADLLALIDGIGEAADETGAIVVGGNLSSGAELSITTTVIGEIDSAPGGESGSAERGDESARFERRPLTRHGARPGDGIYMTGTAGSAALGLALLLAGRGDDPDPRARWFVERWRRPTAAIVQGLRLRGNATACIDVSDGVLQDLGHICEASGVGAEIHAPSLPLGKGFDAVARSADRDPWQLALAGGEDYELVYTAPAHLRELGTRIGRVTETAGRIDVVGPDGTPLEVHAQGFRHFSGRP